MIDVISPWFIEVPCVVVINVSVWFSNIEFFDELIMISSSVEVNVKVCDWVGSIALSVDVIIVISSVEVKGLS